MATIDNNEFSTVRRKGVAKEKPGKWEGKQLITDDYLQTTLKKIEKEKKELMQKIDRDIKDLTDQVVGIVEGRIVLDRKTSDEVSREKNIKKSSDAIFHEKLFKARNSLLTDLFKVNHISTIYHIFIAFLINLIVNTAVYDMIKLGKINLGFKLICWNFQSLPLASAIWLVMQSTTIIVYFLFRKWSSQRFQFSSNLVRKLWDRMFMLLIIMYVILFLIVPAWVILQHQLPIAISFTLLMEQVRFVMKTYSFVRTIVPRVLVVKAVKSHPKEIPFPSLGKYMYFLFAPTLVYRDEYPRTSRIRWKFVFQHFIEIVGVIFYLAFIMENYLIPSVRNFGKKQMTLEQLVIIFFNNNVPCLFVFLCGFYSFLHSWMNAFAELLRFADRMFYQDWWNSSSFPEYYKTWNVIVHDWLYAFVYKDGTELLTKKKAVSTWLVFIISALFHEYILTLTFKFCYPVLFIVFGILSTCLVFIPKNRFSAMGNMLLWLSLFTGTGCCGSLYMLEYYARVNCPRSHESPIRDFFVPRSWTCSSIL